MALTVTPDLTKVNVVGNKRNVPVSITFDSSYATGGEAITAAQCGLVVLERLIFEGPAVDETNDLALTPHYDKTAGKVQLFEANDAAPDSEIGTDNVALFVLPAIAVGY